MLNGRGYTWRAVLQNKYPILNSIGTVSQIDREKAQGNFM
jgi:hypothetical protein